MSKSPALTNLMLVDKINYPYINMTSQLLGGEFFPLVIGFFC